ncbi:MAG: thioredoxin family protein [Firmicutes bacterium]|nr:thioredoxin family protein [Bacillota bacterium]
MKLKKFVCALLCGLLFFTGCVAPKKDYEEVEITFEQLQEKIENKETFVVEIYREHCPFCEKVTNFVEETKQEHPNVVLYRIDCTEWKLQNNEDGTALISETDVGKDFLKQFPGFFYTPTFYAFKNGEALVSAIGFNDFTCDVSLWDVDSVVDFDTADLEYYWNFIEDYQK